MITKRILIESVNGVRRVTTYLCLNKDRKPFVTNDFRKASMSEKVIKIIFKMRDIDKAETDKIINEYIEKNYIKNETNNLDHATDTEE